jgi:peptidoglycan/LPS O-acetylase OafA/YrhL
VFLLRRAVRLWPAYALGMLLGAATTGRWPTPGVMVWFIGWDGATIRAALHPNPPVWALCIYAWMMLLMPVIAMFARGGPWRILLLPPAWAACAIADWHFGWAGWFILGAWLSRFKPRFAPLETPVPQWLGKVSYSLFLVHWPLISGLLAWRGVPGLALGVVLLPIAAWLMWYCVERPSLAASRILGQRLRRGSADDPRLVQAA